MDVPVTCRKCGKKAPASEFTVDPVLKMAVCRSCANERKMAARTTSTSQPLVRNTPTELPKPQKESGAGAGGFQPKPVVRNVPPPGWDVEDELIVKAAAKKASDYEATGLGSAPKLEDGRVLHTCKKCKYQFKYNPETNRPNMCPNCATMVRNAFDR
jgi:predicted Zn-ribbon and HTH transcriptional regulator